MGVLVCVFVRLDKFRLLVNFCFSCTHSERGGVFGGKDISRHLVPLVVVFRAYAGIGVAQRKMYCFLAIIFLKSSIDIMQER